LVVIPQRGDSLAKGLGHTHNEFARWMHVRTRQSGHLWQNRFYSCPLDDRHLPEALRYVELNPVRAGLTPQAWDWPWSSAAAHVSGADSGELLDLGWWREHYDPGRWREVLELGTVGADLCERLRESTRTGRPYGDPGFVETIESRLNRTLRPKPPGRKPSARIAREQLNLGIA
jgi:putative transposase